MNFVALNDRTYACIGENDGGHIRENSGFVVSPRGVVVIDTTWTLRDAEQMAHEIRKVADKKVVYVINTHCHADHVFGNQVFLAPIIAARSTLDRMRSSVANEWSPQNLFQKSLSYRGAGTTPDYPDPERLKEVHIVLPEIAFESQMTLNLGDLELEIVLLGGHTPDSSVVYLPQDKILFASDLLFVDRYPTLRNGNLRDWMKSLDRIKAMDIRTFVPGHGSPCGMEGLEREERYFSDLRERIATLMEQGLSREEIVSHTSIPKYWENDYKRLHGPNIGIAYDQLLQKKVGKTH
jgi:cyclase